MEADKCAQCGCELDGPDESEGTNQIETTNVILLCVECHSNLVGQPPTNFLDWIKLRVEMEESPKAIVSERISL